MKARCRRKFPDCPNEDVRRIVSTPSDRNLSRFPARGCDLAFSEDLAQEVMLTVHRKAAQVRVHTLFRAWLFKIARNALCRHYGKQTREVETVNLTDINERLAASRHKPAAPPVFEFQHWMAFLNSSEREVMTLRFLERWKHHEIADAHTIPIGTIKWRVFNAKKKLAPHLTTRLNSTRKPA